MIEKRALASFGAQVLRLALAMVSAVSLDLPGTPAANKTAYKAISSRKKPTTKKRKYKLSAKARRNMSLAQIARHAMKGNEK